MASKIQDLARWKTIFNGQCAYRSSNVQTGTLRCRHLFTNTAECHHFGCPIVQPNFVALQRSYDTIYLVRKNPDADDFGGIWSDEELPIEKDEALKIVTEATSRLSEMLKEATLTKFEHVFEIVKTIRETLEEEEEEDLLEPLDGLDDVDVDDADVDDVDVDDVDVDDADVDDVDVDDADSQDEDDI